MDRLHRAYPHTGPPSGGARISCAGAQVWLASSGRMANAGAAITSWGAPGASRHAPRCSGPGRRSIAARRRPPRESPSRARCSGQRASSGSPSSRDRAGRRAAGRDRRWPVRHRARSCGASPSTRSARSVIACWAPEVRDRARRGTGRRGDRRRRGDRPRASRARSDAARRRSLRPTAARGSRRSRRSRPAAG